MKGKGEKSISLSSLLSLQTTPRKCLKRQEERGKCFSFFSFLSSDFVSEKYDGKRRKEKEGKAFLLFFSPFRLCFRIE